MARARSLILASGLAAAVATVSGLAWISTRLHAQQPAPAPAVAAATAPQWVVAAPGRVEPRSGEIRIGATLLGRVAEVLVKPNDVVEEGTVLVRLDDEETRARVAAAESEAGARRRERDNQVAISGREEVRRSEDALATADRSVAQARSEVDAAVSAQRAGTGTAEAVTEARRKLSTARDRQTRERNALATALNRSGLPQPSRVEALLTAARSDLAVADAMHEKTRIRAPIGGRVLQLHAKVGETVAPAPEQPLAVIGDMSVVRVKAEVDERDVGKIRQGQRVFVRSEAYPGRDFNGTVVELAPSLAPPRIGLRGPRRPTDVEVMEVTIELEQGTPLLPGMRVDALFQHLPAAPSTASATPGAQSAAPAAPATPTAAATQPAAAGQPGTSSN
jgi:HlyD family secretion protein